MPKFFVSKDNIVDHTITINGENANHIANVLRAKSGDEIIVGDGEGLDYTCEITEVSKKQVIAK